MATGRDFLACHFNVIWNFLSECTKAEPLVKPVHVQTVLKHYKTEILAHVHPPYVTCPALQSRQYGAPRTVSCHVAFVSFSCVSRSRKNIERYLWAHEVGKLKEKNCACTNHECIEGMEVQRHSFLTSALDGRKFRVSRTGRFNPRGNISAIKAGRAPELWRTAPWHFMESNHDSSVVNPSQCPDWAPLYVARYRSWICVHRSESTALNSAQPLRQIDFCQVNAKHCDGVQLAEFTRRAFLFLTFLPHFTKHKQYSQPSNQPTEPKQFLSSTTVQRSSKDELSLHTVHHLHQRHSSGAHAARTTKLWMVAPNASTDVSSVRNWHYVTRLPPRMSKTLLDCSNVCAPVQ